MDVGLHFGDIAMVSASNDGSLDDTDGNRGGKGGGYGMTLRYH